FKPMRHADAILDLEQRRKEGLEVKVGHGVEVRFLAHIVGSEDLAEGLVHIVTMKQIPVHLFIQRRGTIDEPEITLLEIVEQTVTAELLEHRLVFAQGYKVRYDRFIGDDEVAAIHRAIDGGLDALLEIGNQIARVATKDLVPTLATEHDLAPGSC